MYRRVVVFISLLLFAMSSNAQKLECDSLLDKGLQYYSNNQDSLAIRALGKALQCPNNKAYLDDLKLYLANSFYNLNEKDSAFYYYKELISKKTNQYIAYSRTAEYLLSLDSPNYKLITNYLENATSLGDSSAETLTILGISYSRNNRNDLATNVLTQAINKNPNLIIAYFHRGFALKEVGLQKAAIQDLTYFLKFFPNDIVAMYNLAFAYFRDKNFEKALETWIAVDNINKGYLDVYFRIGLTYAQLKEYQKAHDWFTIAIQHNPTKGHLYFNRGIAIGLGKLNYDFCKDFNMANELGYSDAEKMLNIYCK